MHACYQKLVSRRGLNLKSPISTIICSHLLSWEFFSLRAFPYPVVVAAVVSDNFILTSFLRKCAPFHHGLNDFLNRKRRKYIDKELTTLWRKNGSPRPL